MKAIMKYTKKPVTIEAAKYTYPAPKELREWLGESYGGETKNRSPEAKGEMQVITLEDGHDRFSILTAKHIATHGDYIIKGVKGEFYACKPDIFEMTYVEGEGL